MGIRGEVFSTKVSLQNRTYFFNVKENRLGDLYLNIVESKNIETGGFDRQSIVLFAEDLQEFLKGFDESLKVLEKSVRGQKKNLPPRMAPSHREDRDQERGDRPDRDRSEGRDPVRARPDRDRSEGREYGRKTENKFGPSRGGRETSRGRPGSKFGPSSRSRSDSRDQGRSRPDRDRSESREYGRKTENKFGPSRGRSENKFGQDNQKKRVVVRKKTFTDK